MAPIDWLKLAVEQYLRELPDDEFARLVEITRMPQGVSTDG